MWYKAAEEWKTTGVKAGKLTMGCLKCRAAELDRRIITGFYINLF